MAKPACFVPLYEVPSRGSQTTSKRWTVPSNGKASRTVGSHLSVCVLGTWYQIPSSKCSCHRRCLVPPPEPQPTTSGICWCQRPSPRPSSLLLHYSLSPTPTPKTFKMRAEEEEKLAPFGTINGRAGLPERGGGDSPCSAPSPTRSLHRRPLRWTHPEQVCDEPSRLIP